MPSTTSTHDLVERIREGDEEAFSALVRKYERRLAIMIHYRLGRTLNRRTSAEDLLQETFLEAYRDFPRFSYQGPGSVLRWLGRIADRAVLDAARYYGRQKRQAGAVERLRSNTNPGGFEPVDSLSPSRLLAERELMTRLIGKLDQLPESYRSAVLLSRVEGMTNAEIADQLNVSREQAAVTLHRALKRLRELLNEGDS